MTLIDRLVAVLDIKYFGHYDRGATEIVINLIEFEINLTGLDKTIDYILSNRLEYTI